MSESETSSDLLSSTETSDFSTNEDIYEEKNESCQHFDKDKKKIKMMKMSLILLGIVLVVLLVVITILLVYIVYLKSILTTENHLKSTPFNLNSKNTIYNFVHTSNGIKYSSGLVSLPEKIEDSFTTINNPITGIGQSMLLYDKSQVSSIYELKSNIYCCPENSGQGGYDDCVKVANEASINVVGCSLSEAVKNAEKNPDPDDEPNICIQRILDKNLTDDEMERILNKLNSEFVGGNMILEDFECEGKCVPNTFDDFLIYNPTALQETFEQIVQLYEDIAKDEGGPEPIPEHAYRYLRHEFQLRAELCEERRVYGKIQENSDIRMKDLRKDFMEHSLHPICDKYGVVPSQDMKIFYRHACQAKLENVRCRKPTGEYSPWLKEWGQQEITRNEYGELELVTDDDDDEEEV